MIVVIVAMAHGMAWHGSEPTWWVESTLQVEAREEVRRSRVQARGRRNIVDYQIVDTNPHSFILAVLGPRPKID